MKRELEKGTGDDVATLIYTSGTTGEPKGVILSHRNFTFQLERIFDHIGIKAGDTMLSVLPVWHSFERIVEYVLVTIGASIAYSKPVGSVMIADMAKVNPQWMSSVPRIWEGIHNAIYRSVKSGSKVKAILFHFFVGATELYYSFYNKLVGRSAEFIRAVRWLDIIISTIPTVLLWPLKALGAILVFGKIQARLGTSFIAGISGGGALPPHVDKFFQAAGVLLLEGYGLTETGPILAVRKQAHPVMGTVGPLLKDIDHRVLDKESNLVEPGRKGVLYVKSEQVMSGYYKRPEATEEVLKDGWLNTGDIVIFTHQGEFTIIGRSKETIVLTGGENIEPVPIEDKLKEHELIDNVMVVGQDQKFLGALVIPNEESIKAFADERSIDWVDYADLVANPEVHEYVNTAVQGQVNTQTGFKHFERIFRFALLPKEFEVGKELTQTMKFKRKVVEKLYRKEIKDIFS
jgi:long-chain acyl-CoA synthetase